MSSADFPRYFEAQYTEYTEDIPFWLGLAADCGGPVLELGCGYGRILLALAREGWSVAGLDNDRKMLARAAAHLNEDLGHRITLHHADITDFKLDQTFSLVISPCNTFAFLDENKFVLASTCALRHLSPAGRLVLDLPPTPASLVHFAGETELLAAFLEPESGSAVQVSAREHIESPGAPYQVTWLYDELSADGQVARTEVPMTYHLREPELLSRLLGEAGYDRTEFYGDYQRTTYSRESTRLIVVASR
jgi:SAM-dependent methyltransferase